MYNLAVMEKELWFKDLAREKFKFLIHQEDHLKSMINLYLLDLKDEKYLSALKITNLILQKDPTQKDVLRDKAYILYKIQNIEESQKICLFLLQNNNQDYLTLNILGLIYFNKKNFKKAEDIFIKGLKINKNSAVLLNSLGRLYHELRQVNKAENMFLKALKIEPSAYATLNNIAGLYLEEGLYDKAISYYNNAKDIYSNNSDTSYRVRCCDDDNNCYAKDSSTNKCYKSNNNVEMLLSFEILSATEKNFTKEFLPNYFIQINQNSLEKKLKAMKCYKSEIAKHPFSRSLVNIKNLAMHRGSQSGNYYAEAFKIIRLIEKKR